MNEQRCASPQRDPQRWLRQTLAGAGLIKARGLPVREIKELSGLAGKLRSAVDSLLVSFAAEIAASGSAASAQEVLQDTTKMSKRDANRMARTAKGLEDLPNVKKRLEAGEITLGHAGVLVDTARETGPAAVDDNAGLLDRASEAPEDLFAAEAKRFASRQSSDRGEKLLARQRRRRRASVWKDSHTGMGRLSAELDPIAFGLVQQALESHAKKLRRADIAGVDGADGSRSNEQRLADALTERLTGLHALTHEPLLDDPEGHEDPCASVAGQGHRGGSAQLVIVADLALIDGTDPDGRCEIPGTGPVPPSIMERLSRDTKLAGMIFGGDGRALWLGQSRRRANVPLHLAVAVRDRGCVQCGAPMHQCEIHHIRPWEHGGPTDIDNLQALCGQHHRQHHGPHDPAKPRPSPKSPLPDSRNRRADPYSADGGPSHARSGQAGPKSCRGDPIAQRLLL